jgi:glycosyltransferase involved in cell wall biosynthesis
LRDKLLNTVALEYPAEKLEIFVVSDGSEDDIDAVAASFSDFRVKLLKLVPRRGKNYAQMVARDASAGEILVFTDVSVQLDTLALQQIVSNFVDLSVGCVSSEDRIITDSQIRAGEGAYVSLEMRLRRLESQVGSVITASGSFFAVRRELCKEWHPDQTSDFFVVLHAIQQNRRAVVDPLSTGYYGLAQQSGVEFQRKVRTIVNGLHVFFAHVCLLNPLRYPVIAWQLISHKLCRWLLPFGMLAILISSIFLYNSGWLYRACLVAQVAVYSAGVVSLLLRGLLRFPALKLASFFMLGNAATITAWVKFCTGERYVVWEPTRRS